MKKRISRIVPALLAAICALAVPIRAAAAPAFAYEIALTDAAGRALHCREELTAGDEITLVLTLNRTDQSGGYTATGLDFALTTKGLDIQKVSGYPAYVTATTLSKAIAGTRTLTLRYYDLGGVGREFANPLTVCRITCLVTDPAAVSVSLSTRSVFLGTTEYVPKGKADCDLNGDHSVNLMDISLLFQIVSGQRESGSILTNAGDLNDDGRLELEDVALLYKEYNQ